MKLKNIIFDSSSSYVDKSNSDSGTVIEKTYDNKVVVEDSIKLR